MTESSGSWNIGDLADLILGPGSAEGAGADPASDITSDTPSTPLLSQVVLVNPGQDAVEAVGRYAEYWSNRGQTVAVSWAGDSGIKIGLYDHLRRTDWANDLSAALCDDQPDQMVALIRQHLRRLVVAVITQPGWQDSPFVAHCPSACVLVEPSPNQLVRAYECLKFLNASRPECSLSCFVQEALSARQATELSSRLQHMGDQFLKREVVFEGFSLADPSPTTNRVAEAFVQEDGAGSTLLLRQVLLAHLAPDPQHPGEVETPTALDAREAAAPRSDAPAGCLPVVRVLRTPEPICSAEQLDGLVGARIEALCGDVSRTMPVYTSAEGGHCFRWVIHRSGSRSLVVTLLGESGGALEAAAARLHPLQSGDEIIMLAPTLSSEHRRAAQAMHPNTRLFEVAQLPPDQEPGVVLRDVTQALG